VISIHGIEWVSFRVQLAECGRRGETDNSATEGKFIVLMISLEGYSPGTSQSYAICA